MAVTTQASIDNHRRKTITVSTTGGTAGPVYVGDLEDVTVAVRRVSGSTDTASVTGSVDGTNYAAVTSTQQVLDSGGGGDVALTGITARVVHTIRQKVSWIRLNSSGTTDSLEMIVSGRVVS